MTHDSIGLGEDGPTHQPIEHLAMLRATPGLNVFRPADAVETAEAWKKNLLKLTVHLYLLYLDKVCLQLRFENSEENLTKKGGYILKDTNGQRDVTLIASGSEVEIAIKTSELLLEAKH